MLIIGGAMASKLSFLEFAYFGANASWHTSKSFCKVFNEQIKEHGRTKQAVTQNQIS
jgi:hypothetical protein